MVKRFRSPRAMLVFSAIAFGTIGPFVRRIAVSSGEVALYRAVMAAALIGLYFLVTGQRVPFRSIRRELPLLLLAGIAMGFNWILLFEAYKYTTISVATLSYYFAPVIVTVACPVLFREKMTVRQGVCFAMSTLGLVLITGVGDTSAGGQHLLGIGLGLGAACLYATVILLNKYIRNVDGIHRTFLQFLAAALVLAPYAAMTGGFTLHALDGTGWLCLLTVGIFHTGIVYCLYFSALRELPGQQAAILSYIDPLTAVVISVLVLGETLTLPQALGGLLILGFTLWNESSPPSGEGRAPKRRLPN